MAELARTVASPRSVEDVLSDVTATALELIEGAERGRPAACNGGKFEFRRRRGGGGAGRYIQRRWSRSACSVVLAAHAAAIMASRQEEQLESALSTRDRIGQAKGIIMERYGVDDVRAFDMLRRLSQDSNTRLIDVAQRVIDTRGDE